MKKLLTALFIIQFSIISFQLSIVTAQTTKPILRLNSQMHTAKINRISTDAAGKYILTASSDKTAKLWDALTGDLLKTFRSPIDQGSEGALYAGALSPNGKIAAVAESTGKKIRKDNNIYVFNTQTGELIQRLSVHGNVIFDLEFSIDGTYLAAALCSSGVVIYKINLTGINSSKHKTLTGYGDGSYNTSFDHTGRLATVCNDGKIRLYDKHFNLIKKTRGAGKKAYSIAFSPNGNKIAVGYLDVPEIEVFSGNNLKLLYKPELGAINKKGGFGGGLSFSADGKYLYGGGYYQQYIDGNWWTVIRKWTNSGQGSYTDYPACHNTVTDIKPLPNGDILFTGTQPDFGRMNAYGNKIFYKAGEINNFKNSQFKYFKINYSADEIAFTSSGKDAMHFSIADRNLTAFENLSGLNTYTDQKFGIKVSDWENTFSPKINGKKLTFISQYEFCRSTDISPDGNKIVLGTFWNIYCTDASGNKLWKAPVQGTSWAVNISGNGKLVAAAQDGGVINWYRMSDGELVLTLYAHPDNKRWVLFTPGGYYDASPGAESLFGWHLNNGADKEAYFFPASKFRNKYYRPDVIDNILITLNEDEALRIENIAGNRKSNQTKIVNMLPPLVSIIKPYYNQEVSSETITVEYTAKSPNAEPITNVKFMIDGRPVENQRGFKSIAYNKTSKIITIPKRNITIQVLAENIHGWSVPAEVKIKWKGQREAPQNIFKPTLYVLSIGVSDYKNNDYDLKYAAKDARDFSSIMKTQKGGLYKNVVIKTLTDVNATRDNILDGLDWIQSETTSRDMAMIFIAGHGVNDNVGKFYFLPYEADINSLRRTSLLFIELKYTTSEIPGKVIAFVDACHSGNVMGKRRGPDVNNLVNELTDVESGAVVFTSSTGKQYSLENDAWGNGAFTKALIEGMRGNADYLKKDKITIRSLDLYISNRVKELTKGKQSPTVVIPESMSDFPIGIVR